MHRLCRGLIVLLLFWASSLCAGEVATWRKYTHGEVIAETNAIAPGQTGALGLRITLDDQWHTYWINPGDSGTPLHLTFTVDDGARVGRVLMPVPQRFETGPLITFGFAREVLMPIELAVDAGVAVGTDLHVKVEAEWLVCRDICIPAIETFDVDVPVRALTDVKPSDHFAAFQRARARVPSAWPAPARFDDKTNDVHLTLKPWGEDRDFVDFFPFKASGVTNEAPVMSVADGALHLKFKRANVPRAREDRVGVVVTRVKGSRQIEAWQVGDSGWGVEQRGGAGRSSELWWMLLSAFIGGLILNLMPCVFPILSIKLLSLLKLVNARPGQIRAQNAAYVLGVLLSFLTIALTLSGLRAAGQQIGWGFQLQSPLFLTMLIWLFFGLALNLFGLFEIDWLGSGFGHRLTRFDGAVGSFFTGVLAVVVASPCTAPFMGVALGFGLAQPTYVLIAIFVSLGLGLAFPYLIFMIQPRWIGVLPKPGRWMLRVKQVMAFPLLLTDVWLVWILGQVRGPNAMVISLAGCVALGAAIWFSKSYRRWAAVVAVVVMAGGLTLVNHTSDTIARTDVSDVWKPFSPALLESLKGRNVLVDMTADWCLTCKVNERLVFSDAGVMKLIADKKITLVRGDWTQRNPDITRYLARFNRVGVPFYVLYSAAHPEGLPLPEVLTKGAFTDAITREFP